MLPKQILPVFAIFCATLAHARRILATDKTNGDEYEDIDSVTWNEAVSQANATVSLETFGYDVTEEFPGNRTEGWNLTLAIVGDIDYQSRHFSGASLHLQPPARLRNVSQHDSWGSTAEIRSIDFDMNEDVPSDCSGVLSEECLDDLRSNAEGGRGQTDFPESCEDELGDSDNLSLMRAGMLAGEQTDTFGVVLHKPGKTSHYDDLVSRAHIISLAFTEWDDNEPVQDGERLESILVCMRPEQFSEGSRDLEEVEDGAAGFRAGGIYAMVLGAMTAFVVAI